MPQILHFQEETIIRQGIWYPNTICDGMGCILMMGSQQTALFSEDSGRSWQAKADAYFPGFLKCLPDGSVLGIGFHNVVNDKIRRSQRHKPFIAWIRRAASLPALVEGDYEDDFAPMYIPDLDGTNGDAENYCIGYADHGLAALEDGRLICSMYGRFIQDKVKVPYFPDGAYQYRSWICESRNGGKSWDYLQTIGANEIMRLPAISEGYCEPDLAVLSDGGLITVMRTGGCPCNHGSDERYTPLYIRRSSDQGSTWSMPEAIARYGVWPRLLRMKNGLLVCASGRPGVFLLTSEDDGKSWSAPEIVDAYDGPHGKCSSGYNCLEEITPGVLALIYDTVDREQAELPHQMKMRLYTV